MSDTALLEPQTPPKPPPATPLDPALLKPGKFCYVLFWSPRFMPDHSDKGHWDTIDARVIAVGDDLVCVELGTSLARELDVTAENEWGVGLFHTPHGSLLRWTRPTRLFASDGEAIRYTKENTLRK